MDSTLSISFLDCKGGSFFGALGLCALHLPEEGDAVQPVLLQSLTQLDQVNLGASGVGTTDVARFSWSGLTLKELRKSKLTLQPIEAPTAEGEEGRRGGLASVDLSEVHIGQEVDAWFVCTPPESNDEIGELSESQHSVRLRICIDGPMRAEIVALRAAGDKITSTVDMGHDAILPLLVLLKPYVANRVAVITGGLTLTASTVAVAPAAAIVFVLGFPVVLPLLLIAGVLLIWFASLALFIAAASRPGRCAILRKIEPYLENLSHTKLWQQVVYETGPRLTSPAQLVEELIPTNVWGKLLVALCLDFLGNSSYLIPGLGEATDLAYGPLQSMIVQKMFKGVISPYAHYLSLVEEVLPFTDILPSATLLWTRAYGATLFAQYLAFRSTLATSPGKLTIKDFICQSATSPGKLTIKDLRGGADIVMEGVQDNSGGVVIEEVEM